MKEEKNWWVKEWEQQKRKGAKIRVCERREMQLFTRVLCICVCVCCACVCLPYLTHFSKDGSLDHWRWWGVGRRAQLKIRLIPFIYVHTDHPCTDTNTETSPNSLSSLDNPLLSLVLLLSEVPSLYIGLALPPSPQSTQRPVKVGPLAYRDTPQPNTHKHSLTHSYTRAHSSHRTQNIWDSIVH